MKNKDKVAKELMTFLASTYAIYLKTQNFHWNVKGASFIALHELFQKHYEELAEHVDEIAERVVTLGAYVDGTFTNFEKLSVVKSAKMNLDANAMLKDLVSEHGAMRELGAPLVGMFVDLRDDVSSDLIIKCLTFHDKATWMLSSHLV